MNLKLFFQDRVLTRLRAPISLISRTLTMGRIRKDWERAEGRGPTLGERELAALQARYPFRTGYPYDENARRRRGDRRAATLLGLPGVNAARTCVELACSDGMVAASLARGGRLAVATDRRMNSFDVRARSDGAALLVTDSAALALADESVDFVYSYNSFEHFSDPRRVLEEIARVLRPGGHTYHEFGPLYHSAWGEHAYRTITVPYCQFLFSPELMNAFATERGRKPIDFAHVNRWSAGQFRSLWGAVEGLEPVFVREKRDWSQFGVIRCHPQCFHGKAESFDDFFVRDMTLLLRKC